MRNNVVESFGVVTKEFATSFENAFLYISDPENLPKWTVLFREASDSHAVLDTPDGPQQFGFKTHTSFENGVIDWFIISEQGRRVDKSASRLQKLENGNCVYSFMFFVLPQAGESHSEALERQTNLIEEELSRLKVIFEA
ncbi:hypothetical protein EYS14_13835 [Alteromonadaceae bacterium M269]|nr:hypothetical protein EYS14_13835 [Alteromonadaceae bacterium M269]